ncbi:DUF389 domain-containing protein [Psychroflexus planctonicus]|uniref:TIGR00341 family protein n=1 Tax=Psychroflexus planctonicus TaxID=1526575 RepID=A0ABQ1SMF4_9FLAO|nr:DUF389 domain-containing protein [Psychroflexus planctonicus]GGE43279.1 hypothetical protein GCM10010832_24020 [Psychroflexus planctonicus]
MTEKATKTYLIYETEAFESLEDSIKEKIESSFNKIEAFQENIFEQIEKDSRVALYLNDKQIQKSILIAHENNFCIGFLPHPEALEIRNSYAIETDLANAIDDFLEVEKIVETDLLFCNDQLVNNYLVIGDVITEITRKNFRNNPIYKLKRFINFANRLNSVRPTSVTIKADNKDAFETAVAGILITQHAKNSVISRLILEESFLNDGLFHSLIFGPRSFTKIIFAYFKMLFDFRKKTGTSHYQFLGHIKSDSIKINYKDEESCTIDGSMIKSKEFHIKIEGTFKLVPSKSLLFTKEEKGNQSLFKIAHLPKGEDVIEMLSKKLPFIEHASTSEFKDLFTVLRENAKTKSSYIILMVLSTVLASFGLFANSNPIIIGAMILAPLISPVISLSMGTLRQDKSLIRESLTTIGWGLLFSYMAAIVLTLITPLYAINSEISSRLEPNLLDLGVAVVSGMAGAYAHAKTDLAKTLAGVAIAVALVPPLAVSGIGIGWGKWDVFFGAFLLLLTNLTGMVLSGAFTFLLMGFSPFKIAKKGLLISLIIVLAISVPLGYGFIQVVNENKIVNSINNTKVDQLLIKNVEIIKKEPLKLAIKIVGKQAPSDKELDQVKNKIEEILNKKVDLEININLEK